MQAGLVRAIGWSVLAFVLAAALLLPVSYAQFRHNQADLEAATRVQAAETAARLQQEIDHHLKLLDILRDSLLRGEDFMAEASAIARAGPAFEAIIWLTADGRVRTVVPADNNRLAESANDLDAPGIAFGTGLATELRKDGRAVNAYLAVGETNGIIRGVVRLDRLFGGGLLERYAIRVIDGRKMVYAAGEAVPRFPGTPLTAVTFGQLRWDVQLAPRVGRVANFAGQFHDEATAIFGIALLAALLTGLLAFKQISLRHTAQRFRDLDRLLPDMVVECDERWQVSYLNHRARQQLGYGDPELLQGLGLNVLLDVDGRERWLARLRDDSPDAPPLSRVCNVRCHDGTMTACEATLGAVLDDAGRFRGVRAVLRDITERLEAEHAMRRLGGGDSTTAPSNRISRQLNERRQIEGSLRYALQRDELRLFYQPVVNAAEGSIVGLEALLRWQHPERGLLTPVHFVRLAEETGLIDEIGAWVLQEACRQVVAWDKAGLHVPQIAVNVSAHQLESGALDIDVRHALREHGLDGERLVLELTESLLMRDVHFAARILAGLKDHGVRTAVDDFGTGYSSLAYLNRLPIDTLKIDRAFIAPIAETGGDRRVTEAVIALGRLLKLHIIAEGVEQAAQAEFLLEHGCVAMQGFYFCRPMPPAEIPALIARDWRPSATPRRATASLQ